MKALMLESIMTFGKHEGKQVEDLIEDKPEYIRWLCENTATMFDEEVLQALEKREARK